MSTTQWRQPGNGKLSPARISADNYRAATITAVVMTVVGLAIPVVPLLLGLIRWPLAVGLLVVTALLAGYGITFWVVGLNGRRGTVLIDAYGTSAVAQVLAVRIRPWGSESRPGYELDLRISGAGFEAFDTTIQCQAFRRVVVGDRLQVLVVPAAHLFEVRF